MSALLLALSNNVFKLLLSIPLPVVVAPLMAVFLFHEKMMTAYKKVGLQGCNDNF